MKIKIAYQKDEEAEALELVRNVDRLFGCKFVIERKRSDKHEPFYHIYMNLKNRFVRR